jgi:hypothetical protein
MRDENGKLRGFVTLDIFSSWELEGRMKIQNPTDHFLDSSLILGFARVKLGISQFERLLNFGVNKIILYNELTPAEGGIFLPASFMNNCNPQSAPNSIENHF